MPPPLPFLCERRESVRCRISTSTGRKCCSVKQGIDWRCYTYSHRIYIFWPIIRHPPIRTHPARLWGCSKEECAEGTRNQKNATKRGNRRHKTYRTDVALESRRPNRKRKQNNKKPTRRKKMGRKKGPEGPWPAMSEAANNANTSSETSFIVECCVVFQPSHSALHSTHRSTLSGEFRTHNALEKSSSRGNEMR